jgi:hypothetical protein
MKKTAIYSPDVVLVDKYYENKNIIFLDSSGWHVLEKNGQRKKYQIGFSSEIKQGDFNVTAIGKEVSNWSMVWERWISSHESKSIVKSVSIYTILNIAEDLKKLDIDIMIFQTAVPHHYDSSLIHIAGIFAEIKQVYLYAGVIDGRLITLDMSQGLEKRTHTNLEVSDYNSSSAIKDFLSNRIKGNQPKTNAKQALWKKSIIIALMALLYLHIKKYVVDFFIKKDVRCWSEEFELIGMFEDVRIILKQRSYLKLYKSNVNVLVKNHIPSLIITAHYQPEATSYPEGGECADHIQIALSLKNKGYSGPLLYKEHPATDFYTDNTIGITRVGLHRSKKYYQTLKKMNCNFVPNDTVLSMNKGECEWYVPVTIGGTIAIERSLVGLHTIISGEPWFKDLPGVIRLSDISSLANIKKSWSVPDSELATSARLALVNMLTTKTILNYPGVGTGIKLSERYQKDIFLKEFDSLIQGLLKDRTIE